MAPLEDDAPVDGHGLRSDDGRHHWLGRAELLAPLLFDLVCVHTEVRGVVAQEAARVDVAGQVSHIAVFESRKEFHSDLGVSLDAVKIYALHFSGVTQLLANGRSPIAPQPAPTSAPSNASASGTAHWVSARHASSSPYPVFGLDGGPSRRNTWRAFDPSKGPMYPRSSS